MCVQFSLGTKKCEQEKEDKKVDDLVSLLLLLLFVCHRFV